jgi:hypothetical protein
MSHCRLWLLAQTHPSLVFGSDVFSDIYSGLHMHYHPSWIPKLRLQTDVKLYRELGFCYVLDDAQIPGRELSNAFLDSRFHNTLPVLRPLCGTLSRIAGGAQLILAGTRFSRPTIEEAYGSAVLKPYQWIVSSDTGAFTDQVAHSSYIMSYLWPKVSSIDLLDEEARLFLSRCWRWLQGR